jgi:hypothetical protein
MRMLSQGSALMFKIRDLEQIGVPDTLYLQSRIAAPAISNHDVRTMNATHSTECDDETKK